MQPPAHRTVITTDNILAPLIPTIFLPLWEQVMVVTRTQKKKQFQKEAEQRNKEIDSGVVPRSLVQDSTEPQKKDTLENIGSEKSELSEVGETEEDPYPFNEELFGKLRLAKKRLTKI